MKFISNKKACDSFLACLTCGVKLLEYRYTQIWIIAKDESRSYLRLVDLKLLKMLICDKSAQAVSKQQRLYASIIASISAKEVFKRPFIIGATHRNSYNIDRECWGGQIKWLRCQLKYGSLRVLAHSFKCTDIMVFSKRLTEEWLAWKGDNKAENWLWVFNSLVVKAAGRRTGNLYRALYYSSWGGRYHIPISDTPLALSQMWSVCEAYASSYPALDATSEIKQIRAHLKRKTNHLRNRHCA